jgi:hypothetical protein
VPTLSIVNMIPRTLSGEARQDAEPNLAVNPADPRQIVATAFTRDPANGPRAPVFLSRDQGQTGSLRAIVPGGPSTSDISVSFATRGGALYGGILNFTTKNLNVLRTANPFGFAPMTVLVDRPDEDQPWVSAATATTAAGADQDRVFIGHNDFNTAPATASVELSQNARAAPAPGGFASHVIERRATTGQDGPPVRTAVHPSGVVYAAFQRWVQALPSGPGDRRVDIVVVRDDNWGAGPNPFAALVSAADGTPGIRVATNRFVRFTASTGPLGQERIGADLAVTVDPNDPDHVWLGWCDRVGGATGTDWTLHLRRSTDGGRTWSPELRRITNAKNPALAVNANGRLGFMYQQLVGTPPLTRWFTRLELTDDAFASPVTRLLLHRALSSEPPRLGLPYLGDYIRLLAVGDEFYGVFSGSNRPALVNFPNGVRYLRNADFNAQRLLNVDNFSPVPISIDPFFVHWAP